MPPPQWVELVSALSAETEYLLTPAVFTGFPEVWLSDELAKTVAAASREATDNVDRHS
ncbi:hypothetical protein [Mycobacterium sp. MS1601]|uniref:hypothetical protein n=1 Tax=Mycobacterium sp. MS1601 TaxID=1936029 RepID=UPI0012F7BB21|nr:hypothetical protein [Mycobacterium sp. MS1601]